MTVFIILTVHRLLYRTIPEYGILWVTMLHITIYTNINHKV